MPTTLTRSVVLDRHTRRFFTRLQHVAAQFVRLEGVRWSAVNIACGVDIAYHGEQAVAAAAAWDLKAHAMVGVGAVKARVSFPYMPGLLFLRECPLMVAAVEAVTSPVDLVLVDGHGLAHPRRAGLAVFVGLLLDRPTFGVAKSLLAGTLTPWKRNVATMMLQGVPVGYAFKRRGGDFFVSPGHRVSLDDCRRLVKVIGSAYPAALVEAHRRAEERMRMEIGR